MKDEYWATFSIYDHRTPLYRQALLLFDRIVVPIPSREFGGLKNPEIERLRSEVQFLEKQGAAKSIEWDPDEFAVWRSQAEKREVGHSEALARRLAGDPPYLTRLQLKEKTEERAAKLVGEKGISVLAVPVYGSRQNYNAATAQLKDYLREQLTLQVLLKQVPVPAERVAFEDILRLRNRKSFQASLSALRKWQRDTLRELLEEKSEASIQRAVDDFSNKVTKYEEHLKDAKYEKVTTAVSSMLAVGGAMTALAGPVLGTLAALAGPLFSIKKLLKPCWKDIEEKECFPAGVIYESRAVAARKKGQ
jgi:hypothetical protein